MPRLEAQLPEDADPTGTTAEPIQDGSMPDSGPDGGVATREAVSLAPEIRAWAQQAAPDSFAGLWVDQALGGFAVAFASDVDRYAAEIREEVHPGLAVAEANHSYAELRDIQDRLGQSTGVRVMINRTTLGIVDPGEERLAELSQTYGATAICSEIQAAPEPPSEAIEILAKASGWRDDLADELGTAYAVLEVAYDRDAAHLAWNDNVSDDLEPRDDRLPAEPGVYGGLDEVDFDRQAVVVWSSGESGSCREWMTDLDSGDGSIRIVRDAAAQECTDDYNPYRLVVAVDRDRLPSAEELSAARLEDVLDGVVRIYPAGDG